MVDIFLCFLSCDDSKLSDNDLSGHNQATVHHGQELNIARD